MTEVPPGAPPPPGDEIIGRAFRRSLLVILAGAGLVGLIAYFAGRRTPPAPVVVTSPGPAPRPEPAARPPAIRFTDVTAAAGIAFVHVNGAEGDKLLPETMGGGCAFFDADGDGDQDLLLVNSTFWPWARRAGGAGAPRPPTAALYRNDGHGAFEDVTAGSGLDVSLYGMGVATGDYDNDGRVDVFLTASGGNRLFRNTGRAFVDVTRAAGVGGAAGEWSTCAAWIDYDNDGDLDLFVCNYVRWSRAIDFEQDFRLVGIGRAYGPPRAFEGRHPYLYRNDGRGRFTEVAAAAGLHVKNPATGVPVAKSLGVAPADLDADGWIDLVVANDTVPNFLFRNRGDGTFEEMGARAGVGFDSSGAARSAMGIDAAYFRNDGALGYAIGNFANEMTALYVSQGDPLQFADEAIATGIGPPTRLVLTFGVVFLDGDLDGRLDLLAANGHIEDEINTVQASQQYEQSAQLFWNAGADRPPLFVPVSAEQAGPDLFRPMVGRGAAYADIDGDGDLDVLLTQIAGPPRLLRNDQRLSHHYLRLRLTGTRSNRDAVGAWIEVDAGGRTLRRQVMPTRSYLSQVELPVTVGLGPIAKPDAVRVIWPGGTSQPVTDVVIDGTTTVVQRR